MAQTVTMHHALAIWGTVYALVKPRHGVGVGSCLGVGMELWIVRLSSGHPEL